MTLILHNYINIDIIKCHLIAKKPAGAKCDFSNEFGNLVIKWCIL